MDRKVHRPELHFAPEEGVVEAPAGVLLNDKVWHLWFQYRRSVDGPFRWGHNVSEDTPFDWLECDDALGPNEEEKTVRAGSVAAIDDSVCLYYTSVTADETRIELARYIDFNDACELSDDCTVLDQNVERVAVVADDSTAEGFHSFRSPCVVPDWAGEDRQEPHSGWLMLALTGDLDDPRPVVLKSEDGKDWSFVGPVTFDGDSGFAAHDGALPPVVSPRILRLRDEVDGKIYDVVLVTLEVDQQGEISGYVVGELEGSVFHVSQPFQRVDFGHDFTRPRNVNYTEGTIDKATRYDAALLFGLLNGHGRRDEPAAHPSLTAEGWANALSLPRRVSLQGGKLFQTPPNGLPDAVADSRYARMWTGLMDVPEGSKVTVELLNERGNPAAVIEHVGETLTLDRSMGVAFDARYANEPKAQAHLDEGDSDSLTIIVDGSTVEVFADSGQVAMASRVYFVGGCSGFRVTTEGDAEILREFEHAGA